MTGYVIALIACVLLLGGWLAMLTWRVRRLRADLGEPVFRRLPGGRVRFRWSIATAYGTTVTDGWAQSSPTRDSRHGCAVERGNDASRNG